MLVGVYEVRCNLFHGAKAIGDIPRDHPQIFRIGLFRQYTVALLDTFFGKLRRLAPAWNLFFEGWMSEVVTHPKQKAQEEDESPS